MMQVARNLLDAEDGFSLGKTHVILDRDPLYTKHVREFLKDAGVTSVRLPPRSPNLNRYIERFARSTREECLGHMVVLGKGHLRTVIHRYTERFHEEREPQVLDSRLIAPRRDTFESEGGSVRRARSGGLLSYYHRDVA